MKRAITAGLVAFGFVSLVGQVLLAREFVAVFYGNELCLGVILGGWLFWGALGSFTGARLSRQWNERADAAVFATIQVIAAVLLPAQVFTIRSTKLILNWADQALAARVPERFADAVHALLSSTQGEILGPVPMFVWTFLVTAPLALCIGFQFTVACRIYATATHTQGGGVARAYVLDALGNVAGGAALSVLLVWHVDAMWVCGLIGFVALGGAFAVASAGRRRWATGIVVGVLLAWLSGVRLAGFAHLEIASERLRWTGFDLRETRDTIYGKLAVTQRGGLTSFFENGLLTFTTNQRQVYEELVHIPMLVHPNPKQVLLIGGGVAGGLYEVLKHDVERVTYVELDADVISLAKRYLPDQDLRALRDPRVSVRLQDGRAFVKRTDEHFDVLIVALPDPFTAQLNRFYTLEFFRECARLLGQDGVISIGIRSSDTYLGSQMAAYNASIYRTLRRAFSQVMLVPGDHMFLLGSQTGHGFTSEPAVFLDRIAERRKGNETLGDYYIPMRLLPGHLAFVGERLDAVTAVSVNRDFSPVSYYYDIALFTLWFNPAAERAFTLAGRLRLWHVGVAGVALLCVGLLVSRARRRRNAPVVLAVAAIGLSGIMLEIALLFAFQVLYGYVYHRIGIITAAFMLGLVFGSLVEGRKIERVPARARRLACVGWMLAGVAAVLPAGFSLLARVASPAIATVGAEVAFPLLTALVGLLVGAAFPIATQILIASGAGVGEAAGTIYGADLVGACLGALVASTLLLPVLGGSGVCHAAAIMVAATALPLSVAFPSRA